MAKVGTAYAGHRISLHSPRVVGRGRAYDRDVKLWATAAGAVVVVTIAILVTSPSWVSQGCNAASGLECGGVSPLVIAVVGVVASLVLLFIGALRSIR